VAAEAHRQVVRATPTNCNNRLQAKEPVSPPRSELRSRLAMRLAPVGAKAADVRRGAGRGLESGMTYTATGGGVKTWELFLPAVRARRERYQPRLRRNQSSQAYLNPTKMDCLVQPIVGPSGSCFPLTRDIEVDPVAPRGRGIDDQAAPSRGRKVQDGGSESQRPAGVEGRGGQCQD
jgi:hypothetical protein